MEKSESDKISEAIKKPFTDWVKLIIGGIISMIPVINLISAGYAIKNVKTPKKMPEFDFVGDFVLGLKAIIVYLVYLLIPTAIGAFGLYYKGGVGIIAIALIIGVLLVIPAIKATIDLGTTKKIGKALELERIVKESYTTNFLKKVIGMLIIAVIFSIVGAILAKIPWIGWVLTPITEFAGAIAVWSYAGA